MCLCEVQHLHWFPTLYMLFICLCVCVKSSTSIGSHPLYVVYLFMCLCEVQHLHWFPTLAMLFICLCICVKFSTSIGFPPFFIVFVFFFIFCSVPCNVCDITVCSSCVCCVVGQNPSQTSTWCSMVTAQLANMMGDTYFIFCYFLKFIILSLEPIKRCNYTKFNY